MSALAVVLMAGGVAVQALSVLGVALMPNALARLHFNAPGSLAALLIAAALVVEEGIVALTTRALLLAALLLVANPVLSHVVGRAIRLREERR